MFEEFKKFAMRGNVVDLAVGVIIGAAFGKIIASLVTNVIMPPIGHFFGGKDFSNLFINLSNTPVETLKAAQEANVPVIAYGLFINSIIDFLIIAFVLFVIVSRINKMKKEEEAVPKRTCQFCKMEIADDATRCPHCTSELNDVK